LILPGQIWKDTEGNPIQAHGGGILYADGTYYWYGENKDIETVNNRTEVIGVSCYSSKDLIHWKNEGLALSAVNSPDHDLHPRNVLERPKVIYNRKTKKYVMWMHIDTGDYQFARAGIAVSDSPTGPFAYLGSIRPNGQMSRDMTVFADEDEKAYLIFSSEDNSTLYISLLNGDYLAPEETYTRNFVRRFREAPALFKRDGRYYLITSSCTGWDPNEAEYAVAESPLGPWTVAGNPCIGKDADLTFGAQSTFVIQVQHRPEMFIFMADQWNKHDLRDSRYVWLPISFREDRLEIEWRDSWGI
jgi:beta-galactosidase